MLKKIHNRTFEVLGAKSDSIIATFNHELNERADPAYFAPYLKSNRRIIGLTESLIELATLEWTIYSVESQAGAWKHSKLSKTLSLNPSLNLLQLQYDVWSVYCDEKGLSEVENQKIPHVLAIYLKPEERLATFCKVLPEWALVIDALSAGTFTQTDLINHISKKFKVMFPKTHMEDILTHLLKLGIIE